MTEEKRVAYLRIITCGVLNIRMLAFHKKYEQCVTEADHVHNLPSLLEAYSEEKERYYWETERVSYLKYAEPNSTYVFEEYWKIVAPR